MVTLSLAVTSQPFPQQDPSKHNDFIWNSRKIGNKKVATLTIRKDEERDRRSISPVEDDNSGHKNGKRRHAHRHHHGEGERAAMWLENDQSDEGHDRGSAPSEGHTSEGTRHSGRSALEDGHRVRHSDVHPESLQGEDHMPSFPEMLAEAGITLDSSLLESKTTSARRGSGEERRNRNGKKNRRNRGGRRSRKNKNKKKKKGCRRLKGEERRKCQDALRQCNNLKKRKKKRCRADALEAALSEASGRREDIFSFLKNITEMSGKEACHYHYLKSCSTRVGLFTKGPDSDRAVVKCHFRKEFLKCMQNLQQHGTCNPSFHTRGDITALREKIKEFVWTPSSCLISDVVEG